MRRRDTSIFDCSGFVGTGLWFPKWRTQCNTHRVGVLESWVYLLIWHNECVLDAERCRFRAFWSVTLDLSSLLLSYDSRKRENLPSDGTVTTWLPRFTRVSCKVLRSSVQSMRWCRWYRRCFLSPISDQNIIKSTAVLGAFHCSDVFSVDFLMMLLGSFNFACGRYRQDSQWNQWNWTWPSMFAPKKTCVFLFWGLTVRTGGPTSIQVAARPDTNSVAYCLALNDNSTCEYCN